MITPARLDRLILKARDRARQRRWEARRLVCRGADWQDLFLFVEGAVAPESWPVVEEILAQVEAFANRPPRSLANGDLVQDRHGVVQWLWGLRDGWAALPKTVPHAVWLAWRNGHAGRPAGSTSVPLHRCERCWMVLPNSTPDGAGPFLTPCPVCGGERFEYMNLANWGTFHPPGRTSGGATSGR